MQEMQIYIQQTVVYNVITINIIHVIYKHTEKGYKTLYFDAHVNTMIGAISHISKNCKQIKMEAKTH